MSDQRRRTKTGKLLSDDDLDRIADEVAADEPEIDDLRRRRRGRPLVGDAPGTVVAVRMDPKLRADLDAYAESKGQSVSAVIRHAVSQMIENEVSPVR